jgi:endonuclease/exonuclease/phosphatase family metal-dependent hydrolase
MSSGTLRLATFNLKDFFHARNEGESGVVEAKLANVATSLDRARADVVALQEVGSVELLARLVGAVRKLGYGEPVVGSEDRRGIRNVILSRLPVQWSQVHTAAGLDFPRFVEGDPDPFPRRIPLRRGVVHVRIDAGNLGEVDVMTAHFKSGLPARLKTTEGKELPDTTLHAEGSSYVRSLVQRAAEALFVRHLVDGIIARSPDHAICLMGDLNDTLDSLPVRLVRGVDVSSKYHLRSAAEPLDAERRFSCFHGGAPILIDHILLSERLFGGLRSCEIHNEALRYHGPHVDDPPLTPDSDHALTVAEIAAP